MHVVIAHGDESVCQALAQTISEIDDLRMTTCLPKAVADECSGIRPDVVLIDSGDMAVVHEVVGRLRLQPELNDIQVVLVGEPGSSAPPQPDRAGWDGWVPLPPAPSDLVQRLTAARRIHQARQADRDLLKVVSKSRDKLKIVFDALAEPIASLDAQQQILSCNRAFADKCQSTFNELIGSDLLTRPWIQSLGSATETIVTDLAKVFSTGEAERSTLASDDGRCHLDAHLIPIMGDDSVVDQVTLVLADVTAIHRKSQEVLALNNRLTTAMTELNDKNAVLADTLAQLNQSQAHQLQSEKLAAIGQLAAGMAHEINNPIGFVSSNLRTLGGYFQDVTTLIHRYQECAGSILNGESPPDMAKLASQFKSIADWEDNQDVEFLLTDAEELIAECGDGLGRVEKIVRELEEFARPNETAPNVVDLNASLESALGFISSDGLTGIEVHRDFDADASVTATARDINQALLHVLLNAVQAMEGGGQLGLKTHRNADQVTVSISDSGCGIPPDVLPKIFDPFFTTKPVGDGTGLGLNAVYQTVTHHGGTIDVDSQLNAGTTISIHLPVNTSDKA